MTTAGGPSAVAQHAVVGMVAGKILLEVAVKFSQLVRHVNDMLAA